MSMRVCVCMCVPSLDLMHVICFASDIDLLLMMIGSLHVSIAAIKAQCFESVLYVIFYGRVSCL